LRCYRRLRKPNAAEDILDRALPRNVLAHFVASESEKSASSSERSGKCSSSM
jgi:hypothetical protein